MHRLVIALVTLLGLIGGAVVAGYLVLFSVATDRAAALAPGNSVAYLNIYLQPSTGQQMNLAGLIGRLPGFADDASLDDKIDRVVDNLLGEVGLDYNDQVKPWLGTQVAVAAWPADDAVAAPGAVVIVEVKDRTAAEAAVREFVGTDGSAFLTEAYRGVDLHVAEGTAYGFFGDMLVIGQAVESVQAVVDTQAEGDALAERDDFASMMASLESDHLASLFADLDGIANAASAGDELSGVTIVGAALVAEPDGLRVSGSAPFNSEISTPSARAGFALGGEPSSLVDWMPEGTVAELVIFSLAQTLEDAEAAIGSNPAGEEVVNTLDTIRAAAALGLGINIDTDVLPLLDREVGLAIGGLDAGGLPSGQLLLRPEDPEAAEAALATLAERLVEIGAMMRTESVAGVEVTILSIPQVGEIAYALVDGIVILALDAVDIETAIGAHADGRALVASDRYVHTFDLAGERAGNEVYVNIGALVDLMGDGLGLPDDARDILGQVGTFGLTVPSGDDRIDFHAVLTIDEP